jgi:hypothetical protein
MLAKSKRIEKPEKVTIKRKLEAKLAQKVTHPAPSRARRESGLRSARPGQKPQKQAAELQASVVEETKSS